jgi:hypothetical protein
MYRLSLLMRGSRPLMISWKTETRRHDRDQRQNNGFDQPDSITR